MAGIPSVFPVRRSFTLTDAQSQNMRWFHLFFLSFILMTSFAVLALEYYFRNALHLRGMMHIFFFAGMGGLFTAAVVAFIRGLHIQQLFFKKIHAHRSDREVRLESEMKRKETEAVEFLESCVSLFEKAELKHLCDRVMDVGTRVLAADQGSVMLLDGKGRLKIWASRGLSSEIASKVQLRLGERVAGLAALEKNEFLLNGNLDNYPLFKNLEGNPLIRSAMICPIVYEKKVLGIMNLSRTKNQEAFTEQDLTKATLLARQIGAAMHLSQICRVLEDNARQFRSAFDLYQHGREELQEIEKISSVVVPMPKDPRLSA